MNQTVEEFSCKRIGKPNNHFKVGLFNCNTNITWTNVFDKRVSWWQYDSQERNQVQELLVYVDKTTKETSAVVILYH